MSRNTYQPVTEAQKKDYVNWLDNLTTDIEKFDENPNERNIFPGAEHGDIAMIKDLIGQFKATLTGKEAVIN